jgi:hypothetical protein
MHEPAGDEPLRRMIDEMVVLDTLTPIVYIGRLVELTNTTFVLQRADMHDCRDGHANKELYLVEAARDGVAVNRLQVVVMRSTVISVSLLQDVVID